MPRRFQFSLESLLIAVTLAAACAAFSPSVVTFCKQVSRGMEEMSRY
jgi:hypothetical protein